MVKNDVFPEDNLGPSRIVQSVFLPCGHVFFWLCASGKPLKRPQNAPLETKKGSKEGVKHLFPKLLKKHQGLQKHVL